MKLRHPSILNLITLIALLTSLIGGALDYSPAALAESAITKAWQIGQSLKLEQALELAFIST